ncbi:hypothetical protein HDU96_009673 [Phlyctochytrium bullatum]|nr:hypothetical protein HDU96_009673 [Phlyctochytrium bullatum]
MVYFNASNNRLTGDLPLYTNVPDLRVFDVSGNHLEGVVNGTVPGRTLRVYRICRNRNLRGSFIASREAGTDWLENLDLRDVTLSALALPTSVEYVDVSNTSLAGRSLANLDNIYESYGGMRTAGMIGSLPLKHLDISGNSVNTLPSVLPNSLSFFNASGCGLTGTIPSNYSSLGNLTVFDVSTNKLSGLLSLPTSIVELDAEANQFIGPLPNFANLRKLNVSGGNRLNSTLPDPVYRLLQNNTAAVDISGNCFLVDPTRLGSNVVIESYSEARCGPRPAAVFTGTATVPTARGSPTAAGSGSQSFGDRIEERVVDKLVFRVGISVAGFVLLVIVALIWSCFKKKGGEEDEDKADVESAKPDAGGAEEKPAPGTATQAPAAKEKQFV